VMIASVKPFDRIRTFKKYEIVLLWKPL
jgi:hypothetical protein